MLIGRCDLWFLFFKQKTAYEMRISDWSSDVCSSDLLHMMMLEHVHNRAGEFDVMHFHLDYYPFSLMSRQATPFVTTLHGRLDLPEHQPVFASFASIPLVSISTAQRRPLPNINWVETVHHGLPVDLLEPQPIDRKSTRLNSSH